MMQYLKISNIKVHSCIFWIVVLSCSVRKETIGEGANFITAINTNKRDTVVIGSEYETRIYLNSDSLYSIALSNGIEKYLNVVYWDGVTRVK